MTEHELRICHKVLYKFITAERFMRDRVFPPGHGQRKAKLDACDQAMAALEAIKEFAKAHVEGKQKGGY